MKLMFPSIFHLQKLSTKEHISGIGMKQEKTINIGVMKSAMIFLSLSILSIEKPPFININKIHQKTSAYLQNSYLLHLKIILYIFKYAKVRLKVANVQHFGNWIEDFDKRQYNYCIELPRRVGNRY
jgi:hypothetical protein